MTTNKYLVLVHFASKLTRGNLPAVAGKVAAAIRENIDGAEAMLTSDTAVAMAGTSAQDPANIFRAIATELRHGDNLSIIEIGSRIATSHRGLRAWEERAR